MTATSGINSSLFGSDRSARRWFRFLGYSVDNHSSSVPSASVERFQSDYNAAKFKGWGELEVTGRLNADTLNALERAIQWSAMQAETEDLKAAEVWQSLVDQDSAPESNSASFVEITANGIGKLHNADHETVLRCKVIGFELRDDAVLALVEVPPQADLPTGIPGTMACPCFIA